MSIATRPTTRRVTGPAPPVPRPAGPRAGDRALGASLRFAAFAALLLYGCEHWVRQVAPTATRVAFQMTGAGVGLALVLLALGRAPRRREPRGAVRIPARSAGADANAARGAARAVVIVVAVLATTLLALGAAGIPLRFVGWHHWSELGTGVKEGLSALPNLNIPYRGLDLWVRWTVQAGAALLVVMAAVLAFGGRAASDARPRRRIAAALVLATLYAVPVIERNPDSPFLSGTGFAALLALFLAADRLAGIGGARPRLLAVGAGGLALLLAALIAPRLDGGSSWVDYRGLADDLAQRNTDVFDWNHSYTPLKWPRDGRELLRITAKQPSYWKAENLTRFDGKRWVSEVNTDPTGLDSPRPNDEPSWYEDIKVTVRNLRSEQYVGAGYTSDVKGVSRPATAAGSGTFTVSGKALKPGDTYTASVYTPRPSVRQMRAASTDYPDYVLRDLTMELPKSVGGPSPGQPRPDGAQVTTLLFPAFGSTTPITTYIPGRDAYLGGADLMEKSGYRRMWAVAQQLRAEAKTPFDLVRLARQRVQQGTRYTEQPKQAAIPLDGFLFDTKEGYCQQFSGAMALLLRMAGIPARVATGFTPGTLDADRGQYVVRDLDAHSWVEAFFPLIGWVTFDPTPTIAPPAAQDSGDGGDSLDDSAAAQGRSRADVAKAKPTPAAKSTASAGGADDGSSSTPFVLGGVILLLTAGGGAWWWLRPRAALTPVEELRRALARSGRPAEAGLTLQGLELRLAGTPGAQGYVRKLRLARYAGTSEAPTRAERSALREELGAGLGVRGRLRALWALPPQRPRR